MSLTEVCLIRKHNATIQGNENGDQPHSCSVDFASIAVASIVIYVTLMVHVYLRFCGGGNGGMRGKKGRNEDKAEDVVKVQRLFCHNLIWLAMVAQLLNSAFMLGEIIMIFAKQGQLFSVSMADGILQVLCAVVIPVYFDSAEERGAGLLTLLPLFAHFFGMSSVFGLRHLELTKMGFSYSDLRMATTCIAIAVNSLLFTLLSVAAARKLVSDRRQRNSSSSIRDEAASDKVYRYDNASLASKMTFSWMLPLLRRGYKTPLEIADLHQLPERERARKHYEIMKKLTRRPEDGIIRQCIYMNSKLIVIGGIFRFWADIFGLAGALSIKFIVDSMSEEAYRLLQSEAKANETLTSDSMLPDYQPSYHALSVEEFFSDSYVIAVLIFLAALCQGSFSQTANHLLTLAGMRAKNALHVRLYEKALRLPVGTAQRGSASPSTEEMPICFENSCSADDEAMANEGNIDIGFITNLASDDILNIREFIWNIHYLWALPLKVIVIIGLLYLKMGISGAVGVIIGTLVIVPLQFLTGKLMSDNNKRIFTAQDIRLFKASETMQGMKTVKLGCLEDFMLGKINAARKMELRFLRRDSFFWSVMAFLASVSTIIVTTVTVGLYVALEEEHFSAADIFSALALLGQLTVCLSVFPVTIPIFIKGMVSRERLVEFFSRTEVSIYKESDRKDSKKSTKWSEQAKAKDYENDDCEEETENNTPEYNENDIEKKRPFSAVGSVQPSVSSSSAFPDIAFSISSGFFGWPKSNRCVLKDINMHVRTGTLTAVVGPSGGGKSALILALMEEMERVRGHVKWNLPSAVALTGQNPWLLNASVKDNVLLGRPYREKRYQKVLAACDLNADIELLPDGDETEVGERGVLLSGGQRQRLAIARCLYSKAACTFLDAPFNSLDSNITTHIFHQGVLGILLKRKRTVFIATDREDFLQKADKVIYMSDGGIVDQGKMSYLLKSHPELRMNVRDILSRSPSLFDNGAAGLVEGKTAQERWKLLKNVTKWSIYIKQVHRDGGGYCSGDAASVTSSIRPKASSRKLQKMLSSNKLMRSQMRMDSSSQLSICHDIMLPSDEVSEDASFINSSSSGSKTRSKGSVVGRGGGAAAGKSLRNKPLAANKRLTFSRASSWSTSFQTSFRRRALPGRVVSALPQRPSQNSLSEVERRPLAPGISRQAVVTSANSALSSRRNFSQSGEFQRMSSSQQVMAFKGTRFNSGGTGNNNSSGSISSMSKDSYGEQDGIMMSDGLFSMGGRSSSRQSSIQDGVGSASIGLAGHHARISRMTSNTSAISQISGFSDDFREDDEDDGLILSRDLSNSERREYGQIGVNVYKEYFRAGGFHFAAIFMFLSIGLQCIKVYMDFLLRDWSLDGERSNISYFSFYSSLSISVLVFSCAANLIGQLIGARARTNLHESLLRNLLRCPLDLFETWPISRIINRLSYDMFIIDQKLPSSIQRLVLVTLICLSALVVNAIQSPVFILFAIPMIIVYWWVQHFYRYTSRELQRLESISRTPVLSHFTDTLGGLVTVRAFGEQQRFINQLCEKIDKNTTAFLILQSGCRWLGFTLDFTGAVMVLASVLINLVVCHWYPGTRSSASVGLSMNYSLLVPIYLAWVIKFLADIENYMNAVERILEYTNLESESADESVMPSAPEEQISGLSEGHVKFDNISLSHSMDLRAVIQGMSLDIPAGQKVGICGRSGSGKSTLLMGLSRVAKLLYGSISVDGRDIRTINLRELRTFVWSVPQDVTLFSGTIRTNIDPESRFSDAEIWQALEKIGLKFFVTTMDNGLDADVMENGDNFSHGQKQELSLARAILLQPKIVILDESTSALDAVSEIRLHKQLLAAFAESTVITVAHRLSNIIAYDRVLVMGDGRLLEDGHPRELLKKPMGFFSALWRAAGEKPF